MMADVDPSEAVMLTCLQDRLFVDRALAMRLAVIEDGDAFAAAARRTAQELGLEIGPDAIAALGPPDPLGVERFSRPRANRHVWPAADWLPVAVIDGADGPLVEWLHFAGRRLADPFFEDSVRRARRLPVNRLLRVRTPLDVFAEKMPVDAACAPAGLIYHLSRCGSTLVAQMLAADETHVVVSEAAPLDALVQLADRASAAERPSAIARLRAMASALSRDRHGDRRHAIFKLDCWHMLAAPVLAEAFPEAARIFLYRDPTEILVSHTRQPGIQTVPGMLPQIAATAEDSADPLGFGARLLGRIADAAADAVAAGEMITIHYDRLPAAVFDCVMPRFGLAPADGALAAIRASAARDAKRPGMCFAEDRAAKQAAATPEIRARATAYLQDPIARLDAAGAPR